MSEGTPAMTYDLILRGGRVIDPSQKLDAITDVAFSGGKVAQIGRASKPMFATFPALSSRRD
jgi:dihydroorotase